LMEGRRRPRYRVRQIEVFDRGRKPGFTHLAGFFRDCDNLGGITEVKHISADDVI
jgi:hypothetical protein